MTRIVVSVAAGLCLASVANAQSLFVITGTSNGTPIASVGADNIIDLVSDAVDNQGQFTGLAGTTAALSLSYGGVANAITIDKDAANTSATLSFLNPDGSRTTRNFTTANGPLEDQIRDYLQSDGSADLASFFAAMNALSVIAVSDGNPNATTARMANLSYERFGRSNRTTAMWTTTPAADARQPAPYQFRLGASANAFEAGAFDGASAEVHATSDWNFSTAVGTSAGAFVAYTGIGDANVFHFGASLGVPIRPVLPTEKLPLTWQITPSVSIAGSGSEEIGAGGLIYSGAVTSLLRFEINKVVAIEMANQWGFYEGEELSFGEFSIDPGVSQSILKNGLFAEVILGEAGWYAYGGATLTNFLDNASVEEYVTPDIGVGWRKNPFSGTGFECGLTGDFGEDFSSYGARITVNWAF